MEESKEEKVKSELKKIKPLKDFILRHNEFYYEIKKGEEIEVHRKFLPTLKTEKVIKE